MAEQRVDENTLWTPANIVTLVRILLVPVFVVAIISPWPDYFPQWPEADLWKPWVAAFIFALLSCTDAVDGYLARSRGEVTNFGKFIDPLADKILVAAALLALIELQVLPSWVGLIILAREFIVSGLRMLAASKGVVVAASWYGKAKTVFQIVAILLFIIKDSDMLLSVSGAIEWPLYIFSWFVMVIALILTIVSMVDYFVKCAPVLGFGTKAAKKAQAATNNSDEASNAVAEITDANLNELASQVIDAARNAGKKISTAESCTGGLIGGALTSVAGSSDVVEGGIISYSNEVKKAVLGVSEENLSAYGAVSSQVAEQMACGSIAACGSDIAVAVTGIAGPGGAVPGKPVGTVWFGIASKSQVRSEVCQFDGDRDEVRRATVKHALNLVLSEI